MGKVVTFTAGWVEPPKYKKGDDPLGVQQPCIAVYSTLLPGVTNVTDRVAYYGFGPWFTWALALTANRAVAAAPSTRTGHPRVCSSNAIGS